MSEKNTNTCGQHHDHPGHMCVLVSEGKFDEIRDLVANPKFLCFNCGRVADNKVNLCNPMPLKK